MKKYVYRQREVTFEVEVGAVIKATAKGYSKQAVKVFGGESPQSYTMDGTLVPILELDKKSMSGDITISVSTFDVLVIKKSLFGIKVAELNSM